VTVNVPFYESRAVTITFKSHSTTPYVSVDGPTDSPHRYDDGTLCMWFPGDPNGEASEAGRLAREDASRPSVVRLEGPIENLARILCGMGRHPMAVRLAAGRQCTWVDGSTAQAHPTGLGCLRDLPE
jgi:hypothetical protein